MVLFGIICWEWCFYPAIFEFTPFEVENPTALKFIFILSPFYLIASALFLSYKGLANSEIDCESLCKLLSKLIKIYVLAFMVYFKVGFPARLFARSKMKCLNMN
jgi:hypothetical protein